MNYRYLCPVATIHIAGVSAIRPHAHFPIIIMDYGLQLPQGGITPIPYRN